MRLCEFGALRDESILEPRAHRQKGEKSSSPGLLTKTTCTNDPEFQTPIDQNHYLLRTFRKILLENLRFSRVVRPKIRPVLGRTDFARISIFEQPDFLRGVCRRFFLPILWGNVPRKILQENPWQILQILRNKSFRPYEDKVSSLGPCSVGKRPDTVSESTVLNTKLSEFFRPYYWCATANSPTFFSQNSVSSLLQNSPLETVFRPFPATWIFISELSNADLNFAVDSAPLLFQEKTAPKF